MARAPEVTFYLLSQADEQAWLAQVCTLVTSQFSQRRKVAIRARSQEQAESIDELLWQQPTDRFIPHNLLGEGPAGGAPVVIGWDQPAEAFGYGRQVVINLANDSAPFLRGTQHIIDFVPAQDADKELARERFRNYRRSGANIETVPLQQD
ncbi:DNA polymerase III subunit chi [Aliidiomarina haloalkalitolerans]|uniref:DNA polymerase III subunit chi n=1 Tax=Aliidiomarina haloalkalitolerans TaxID=859059 RepID=A0A432VQN7_9GAMM|nr:DNA polymerase III subunit chi [Aliidiomarina haloalkalitolerans]RUO18405.1 DNA polymerase III subunit chi [Aliidiomarina haloalkalitolerans]